MENNKDAGLKSTWWSLRLVYGVIPIVAGLDKFTNLLTDWTRYLSPTVEGLLPMSGESFMMVVGVIEIAAGLLVLSPLTRIGAYVVAGWLVAIALNLIFTVQYFDVAARDVALAVGAFALARLTELRGEQSAQAPSSNVPARGVPVAG